MAKNCASTLREMTAIPHGRGNLKTLLFELPSVFLDPKQRCEDSDHCKTYKNKLHLKEVSRILYHCAERQ